MKLSPIIALSGFVTALTAFKAFACGPFFPVSYFPYDFDFNREYSMSMTDMSGDADAPSCAYRVTPHLGTELSIIGAHYYPAWTGKAPKSNRVSTAQADEMDFYAAGAAAGVSKKIVEDDWQQFNSFCKNVCKRLESGENVVLPQKIPDYALEFYLYKLGHAQWLVFRKDDDPEPFGKLLALPKERRLYRTVWVHFVRIANARSFSDKDIHLDALRKAVDAGFKDTAALEEFSIRFLSKTCGKRYYPLVLTAYARTPWEKWPDFAKNIFCSRHTIESPDKKWIKTMCADPVGIEVAIAHGAGGKLPAGTVPPDKPALGADRQAWIAFNRGDIDLSRKLLSMAPEKSLIRLFLEARLARLNGDYEKSAVFLHEWLNEYRLRESQQGDGVVGYCISSLDDLYWSTGLNNDGEWGFNGTINYTGIYGPSGHFYEGLFGRFRNQAVLQSHEPVLSRIVSGELGVVMVATRDLEEALFAFLQARNWIDIAFVAERCMTVDELMKFMNGSKIEQADKEHLCSLLMRRLMRCGRVQEAIAWAPHDLKPLLEEYVALSAVAGDVNADADTRAVAFLNLSRLIATRGMEIMGTELRPDVAIYDGDYPGDEVPIAEPVDLPKRLGMDGAMAKWSGWNPPNDRKTERFHYRRTAKDFAKSSVLLAKDDDVRAWALMFGGVVSLSMSDTGEADWFYKRLASMRHPRAKVDAWLNGAVYQWFREKYYNKERHLEPMRVPPRFTKEQLKQLKAPQQ